MDLIINATMHSDLNWKKERQIAEKSRSKILWLIDLGLFDRLPLPLSSEMQFKTLSLGLDHFCTTLGREFCEKTKGICLYRGLLDFSTSFPWDNEQIEGFQLWLQDTFGEIGILNHETGRGFSSFKECLPESLQEHARFYCRDVCLGFVELFAKRIPLFQKFEPVAKLHGSEKSKILRPIAQERLQPFRRTDGGLPGRVGEEVWVQPDLKGRFYAPKSFAIGSFVYLDAQKIQDPLECALLLNGGFRDLKLIGKNLPYRTQPQANLGVCLPFSGGYRPSLLDRWNDAFKFLIQKKIDFRILSEQTLTMDWNGIDDLMVASRCIDESGLRKLQGFCAAGGRVINIDDFPLYLSQEISFERWLNTISEDCMMTKKETDK